MSTAQSVPGPRATSSPRTSYSSDSPAPKIEPMTPPEPVTSTRGRPRAPAVSDGLETTLGRRRRDLVAHRPTRFRLRDPLSRDTAAYYSIRSGRLALYLTANPASRWRRCAGRARPYL